MNVLIALLIGFALFFKPPLFGDERPIPRKVLALYHSEEHPDIWYSSVHQFAAMPLEHLGIIVNYHDISNGFPAVEDDDALLGIIAWTLTRIDEETSKAYLAWVQRLAEKGKKLVFMGTFPGEGIDTQDDNVLNAIRQFWRKLGLEYYHDWIDNTYDARIAYQDPAMTGFERQYVGLLPPFPKLKLYGGQLKAHLTLRLRDDEKTDSVLVASGPQLSYCVDSYGVYVYFDRDREFRKWYINPFQFFRDAFETDVIPKPDVTTYAGKRIYYSHIDGDGWNSLSEVEKFRTKRAIASRVILEDIIKTHPQLPVTVAPIGADIDLEWAAIEKSKAVVKEILSLNQVECASHTYSHPFQWSFFKHYTPEKERPYLNLYPFGGWEKEGLVNAVYSWFQKEDGERKIKREKTFSYPAESLNDEYTVPRAFANQVFDLKKEITGSIDKINSFAPKGKRVKLLQWSGDCQPFEEALRLTEEAGIKNLNGGDTRFDSYHASYSWVRPLSRPVSRFRQIYASMSNENTYTDLWTSKFFGFDQLPYTLHNTNIPIRLRPINLYYHMYSGEKLAALKALNQNIDYILDQEIHPITTSDFAGIVEGFYSVKLIPIGQDQWKVCERGKLQTIRFDRATYRGVDFVRSKGVLGQKHLHGSLYIALDKAVEEPLIVLKEIETATEEPNSDQPYLISSTWDVYRLVRTNDKRFSFNAKGFGLGELRWKVPEDGLYVISDDKGKITRHVQAMNRELLFVLTESGFDDSLQITVSKSDES